MPLFSTLTLNMRNQSQHLRQALGNLNLHKLRGPKQSTNTANEVLFRLPLPLSKTRLEIDIFNTF